MILVLFKASNDAFKWEKRACGAIHLHGIKKNVGEGQATFLAETHTFRIVS